MLGPSIISWYSRTRPQERTYRVFSGQELPEGVSSEGSDEPIETQVYCEEDRCFYVPMLVRVPCLPWGERLVLRHVPIEPPREEVRLDDLVSERI